MYYVKDNHTDNETKIAIQFIIVQNICHAAHLLIEMWNMMSMCEG